MLSIVTTPLLPQSSSFLSPKDHQCFCLAFRGGQAGTHTHTSAPSHLCHILQDSHPGQFLLNRSKLMNFVSKLRPICRMVHLSDQDGQVIKGLGVALGFKHCGMNGGK